MIDKTLKMTPAYVDMLEDVSKFLQFPWERISFLRTLSHFGPEPVTNDNPDPLLGLQHRLRQKTSACYGFPLSLQLIAFEAIPLLLHKIPDAVSTATFLEKPDACDNPNTVLHVSDIVQVETNSEVFYAL